MRFLGLAFKREASIIIPAQLLDPIFILVQHKRHYCHCRSREQALRSHQSHPHEHAEDKRKELLSPLMLSLFPPRLALSLSLSLSLQLNLNRI
jgi:hypothetical protein